MERSVDKINYDSEYEVTSNSTAESADVACNNETIFFPTRMYISGVMGIDELALELVNNINIIIGANSTGKTAILKSLYATMMGYSNGRSMPTKDKKTAEIVKKIKYVFRPEDLKIGNIVNKNKDRALIRIEYELGKPLEVGFGKGASEHITLKDEGKKNVDTKIIYIPPKEMASVDGFVSLYEDYHVAFEDMYNDLARLLSMPEKKNIGKEEKEIIAQLSQLIGASIEYKNGKLYFKEGDNILEMGLVSEGYRKIATLIYLIANGNIKKGNILIWDEPETNLNPIMMEKVIKAILAIAQMGVQVFVTTHDYFVSQELGLAAHYKTCPLSYRFFSLYKNNGVIRAEVNDDLYEIENNSIMEQFDELYNRENKYRWKEVME